MVLSINLDNCQTRKCYLIVSGNGTGTVSLTNPWSKFLMKNMVVHNCSLIRLEGASSIIRINIATFTYHPVKHSDSLCIPDGK